MKLENYENVQWHYNDLDEVSATIMLFAKNVSIDCESTGNDSKTDKLKTIQLKANNMTDTHIIIVNNGKKIAKNLFHILSSPNVKKTFHYAMFDLKFIMAHYQQNKETPQNIWCTKLMAKVLAVEIHKHNRVDKSMFTLEHLLKNRLGADKPEVIKTGEWGNTSKDYSKEQINYLIGDVIHLDDLRKTLFLEIVQVGIEHDVMELLGIIPTMLKGQMKYGEVEIWNY